MPLQPVPSEDSERPLWVPELPVDGSRAEDDLARAIESSEDEGLRFLADLLSGRTRWGREGAFLVLKNDSRGLSAVHLAVLCKRYKTLNALLSSELVDINLLSTNAAKKGWTALHFAAFVLDLRAIHILRDFRCDTSLVTELGSTPLHFVTGRFGKRGAQAHVYSTMKALTLAGVNPEATNKYGYTVLHESIMWSDMTSLGVLLEQSTAQFFGRLPSIGSHVLPHELARRSLTLPAVLKNTLENTYFAQKQLNESTGVTTEINIDILHDLEKLQCICNPSPPTVERTNFLHPESLTAGDLGSLIHSTPDSLVVELLKRQQSVVEYRDRLSGETRYVFPAYFQLTVAKWVCDDCRNCPVVAGRWFEMETDVAAKNFLLQLMTLVLSEVSFPNSAAVDSAAYFATATGVQLGLRHVDRVRGRGVIIQVCSSTPEMVTECRKLLDYVVESSYRLHEGIGQFAVVSSRDLRAGKSIPHLFSRSEVGQAVASHVSFLSNPASMHTAETLADLLLSCSPPQTEAVVELDVGLGTIAMPHRVPYDIFNVWSGDVYSRAVANHRDDIANLVNPELVADCLVSEGAFSPSDRTYVTSGNDDSEKVSRLLEKVEERGAYFNCFSILQETGRELLAHDKLSEILSKTCSEIDCSGSLNNFYLDQDNVPLPHSLPLRSGSRRSRIESHSAPSGRVTEESGYGTHTSVHSGNLSTQIPSLPLSRLPDLPLPSVSPEEHSAPTFPSSPPQPLRGFIQRGPILYTSSPFSCTRSVSSSHHFFCRECAHQENCCPFHKSSLAGSRACHEEASFSVPTTPLLSRGSTAPIAIPSRSGSLTSSQGRTSTTDMPQEQPLAKPAKHLPNTTQPPSLWKRVSDALFSAPTLATDDEDTFPGLKQF